jgi:hypothetical protein
MVPLATSADDKGAVIVAGFENNNNSNGNS